MNKLVPLVFAMLILLTPAQADVTAVSSRNLIEWLFSIYPDYQYVEGSIQRTFDRCNPCTFYINVAHEQQFFDSLIFDMQAFGGTLGYEAGCITVTSADVALGYRELSRWCRNHEYYGYGSSPETQYVWWYGCGEVSQDCKDKKDGSCIGEQIQCYKRRTVVPSSVVAKMGTVELWRMSSASQFTPTIDLATILNTECREHLEACYNYNSLGYLSYRDKCNEDCLVPVVVTSNVNAGGFEATTTPTTLEYLPLGENPFVIPPPLETYYRFENNKCSAISIDPLDKTSNDYTTLEECMSNIYLPPPPPVDFPWAVAVVCVVLGIIAILYL